MDQRSNKRGGPGGLPPPNHTPQPCNRTGCSGRTNLNRCQNTRFGSSDKSKSPNPPTRNEATRKPAAIRSIPTTVKNPHLDSRRKLDLPRRITGESSVPTSSRSSELGQFNRKNSAKRRSLEGESSSSHRERKTTSSASSSVSTLNTGGNAPHRTSRRSSSSVREGEPSVTVSRIPDRRLPANVGGNNNNNNNGGNSSVFTSTLPGFTHLTNDDDDDDDVFHHMDGITEMLFTLERIEQDLELTHEELVALETTLFLGGLNLYDQHRDMRLDIDDMSYEELLALEERMGTVSTALPHEALSKCLTKSVYEVCPSKPRITGSIDDHGDDFKCCICQDEYVNGDEIGTLVKCRHGYHTVCLKRWLQLKNWCPICKTSATPSQSSLSL